MSCWRNIASLPSFMSTGDFAASRSAQSATAASNSSAGTTRLTSPIRSRLLRVDRSPSSSSSLVFLRADVAVDQRHDHEREHADVDLGRPERRRPPWRRSGRRRARCPSAPASTCPLAAQIVGLPSSPISREQRAGSARSRSACARAARRPRSPPRLRARGERPSRAWRSSTTQRTASSSRAALERGDQVGEQRVGQRVARVGLVQRDRRDAVGDVVAEGVVGHAAHATGCSGK